MQTAAKTIRFLTGCSSKAGFADSEIVVSHSRLIQHLVVSHLAPTVSSQDTFLKLTKALIPIAEQAYILRDLDALQEASRVLMSLPVDATRQIGLYYHALAIKRNGQINDAQRLFEIVAYNAPADYRARAIQALGTAYYDSGQLDEALRLQVEALRAASDKNAHGLQTTLMARLQISVITSVNGDHKRALSTLEGLSPLVKVIAKQQPFYFYAYCNELAIEFGELGCNTEAECALEVALASPYAAAYPNWAETRQELEAKRTSATPSVVAITQTPEVISAPQMKPQPCPIRSKPTQIRKRVFAFCWLSSRGTFHRALVSIVRFIAIANCQTNRITLDQLGRCIQSRAPPA